MYFKVTFTLCSRCLPALRRVTHFFPPHRPHRGPAGERQLPDQWLVSRLSVPPGSHESRRSTSAAINRLIKCWLSMSGHKNGAGVTGGAQGGRKPAAVASAADSLHLKLHTLWHARQSKPTPIQPDSTRPNAWSDQTRSDLARPGSAQPGPSRSRQ